MILALALALTDPAAAAVQRWAVVVGNNEGSSSTRPLYFAEQDARKMKSILVGLGDVEETRVDLLLGGTRNELLMAMADIRPSIVAARNGGDQTVLYFYYSGHADDQQLQLGRTWVTWTELETLLEKSGADVRVAFVDACQSGALTRTKGGQMAPSFVFDVAERLDASGSYIVTSSAGDEASQESNEIGGSYFTHFLASALSGTADEDGDGRVTLSETYRYVYHETLYRTTKTRGGPQHPTYESRLSGTGDVVLTELGRAGGTLVFPAENPGDFAVFDVERRMFVAEVGVDDADRRLSLPAGRYLVQRRYPTHLAVSDVSVASGQATRLTASGFRALEYEDDVAKGSIDKVIRKAQLPRLSVRIVSGARGFSDPGVKSAYFPDTPAAGAEARFHWRDGRWASLDVVGGTGTGDLAVDGLPYTVPVRVSSAAFGGGVGYATREAPFRIGGGLHLEGIWLSRAFPGQGVESQELFTVAPGLMAWAGWYPKRVELELALRSHYLPYVVDGRDTGMGFSELVLAFGYRF